MFFRVLLWGILLYMVYKLMKRFFRAFVGMFESKEEEAPVRGKPKKKKLELDENIKDAEFTDLDDKD
ncbi:MAG: hypothetical protein GXO82_03620 [Chlorobi bacterium]|nr:hypothetical protein [Chlorobiota bacterium]